jgi:hypothetical protein
MVDNEPAPGRRVNSRVKHLRYSQILIDFLGSAVVSTAAFGVSPKAFLVRA